ncbi:MAG: roadblock/LC7 domain-containing protein [Candidatus Thermoplasmatota archaeon]|nr:roadblock/LC7 domain-containing protein [Candidatus Thermoplasmatota archaeon]
MTLLCIGVGLVSSGSLDPHLSKIRKAEGIQAATVVSRSGMHVAGSTPEKVHMETFVAMSAIVVGAAETASSELKGDLKWVEIRTNTHTLVMTGLGKKAILAITANPEVKAEDLLSLLSDGIRAMKKVLD